MRKVALNREFIYNKHHHTLDILEVELNNDIKNINYILNYDGFWNVDDFMNLYGLTREILLQDLNELINDFPTSKNIKEALSKKEKDEYIEAYYDAKRLLTNIQYPSLLFLFKDDTIVSISKINQNIKQRIGYHRETKDFDTYTYVYMDFAYSYDNETILNDVYTESIVRYNPRYINIRAIEMSNSIYRTLNQVKRRYKGIKHIDLSIIKKVAQIYEVPTHILNNGQVVIDKD